ncbi:MAG: MAPEG family protein [Hyphomonas sp.]|uniref:MAPEG family protein n=1 Tax=Hyphomonas sp. TaxID=87 RepID=UPI0034A04E0D
MTPIAATTLYIGLFALLMLVLKLNVGRVRSSKKINLGDGNDDSMQRAIRVQGNAVEDVPVVLFGLVGLGLLAAPVLLIHGLGVSFLIARILHAIGLGGVAGAGIGRLIGTLVSLIVMIATAAACIWYALA